MAVLIAVGVHSTGEREVVGVDVGPAEDHEFLRQLVSRGLSGVRLVISDSHLGLKQAVARVFVGSTWQRCRVHFMRNAMATVPKVAQQMVAATLRTVFAQPDQASAHDTIERICRLFEKSFKTALARISSCARRGEQRFGPMPPLQAKITNFSVCSAFFHQLVLGLGDPGRDVRL